MAYNIVFRKCLSPVNKFDKEFDEEFYGCRVALKEKTDVYKPTFVLTTSEELWNYNYVDGSEFSGRKYFIVDVRSIGYLQYEVDCRTDVLSTWATQIRNNTAVVKRQEKMFNLYLDDPDFHVYNFEKIKTIKFPENAFVKELEYILVTNGANNSNQLEGGESDGSNVLQVS